MRAREVLASGDRSATGIAAEVGYTSQSAFDKAFREASDTTPRRFREASRQPSRRHRVR